MDDQDVQQPGKPAGWRRAKDIFVAAQIAGHFVNPLYGPAASQLHLPAEAQHTVAAQAEQREQTEGLEWIDLQHERETDQAIRDLGEQGPSRHTARRDRQADR
jgi:hypothetical protein